MTNSMKNYHTSARGDIFIFQRLKLLDLTFRKAQVFAQKASSISN